MARIEKKCWPEFFEKIASGDKNFDIRLDDFSCKAGDVLVLKEWDPSTRSYTGRSLEKKITYVMKIKDMKFWRKADIEKYGFQVISFK